MRRRLPLLTAALTVLLAFPTGASAAILDVRIDTAAGPALCVSTSGLVTSVTVIVNRPGGATLAKLASALPQATQCDGSAGRSFRPDVPYAGLDGAAGASLEIADSSGDSVTVPFGVASFQTVHGGFSGVLHLRNLPSGGTTQITNGGSLGPTPVSSGSFDSGEIATPGAAVTVTATVGGKAVRAVLSPRPFAPNVSVGRRRDQRDGARRRSGRRGGRNRPDGARRSVDCAHIGGRPHRFRARCDCDSAVRRAARVRRDRGTRPVVVHDAARDRRVHGRRVRGRDPLLGSGLRWRSCLHHGLLLLVARAARPCGLGGQHRRARAVRRTRARRVRRERLRRIWGNGAQHCGGDGRVARGRRQRDGRPDRAVPRDIQPAHHRRWRARFARRRQPPRTRNTPPARGCVHLLTPRPAAGAAHDADGTHQPDGRRRSRARARRLSASRRRRRDGRPEWRRGGLGAARLPLPPGRNAGRIRAVGVGGRGRPRAGRARPGRRRRFATRDRIGFRGLLGRPRRSVSRRSRSSSARPTRPPTA